MSTDVLILEQLTYTAPLGVRFWDVASGGPAESGLMVAAYPDAFPEQRTTAIVGHTGVYSFPVLPGLRNVAFGAGDDKFWSANPASIPYTIEVQDPEERYLPYLFSALLPVRGLFGLWASPLFTALTPDPTWLPLFSAPARQLPNSNASVLAQLQDDFSKSAAAWAIVTVHAHGLPLCAGLSDERGMVMVSQPYPEPVGNLITSPLSAPNLVEQSWDVEVAVFYNGGKTSDPLPDLQQILQQNTAFVWRDSAHTASVDQFTLQYGKDLVLRSLDSSSGNELSELLITSAGSPL